MKIVIDSPVLVGAVLPQSNLLLCRNFLKTVYLDPRVKIFEPYLACFELLTTVCRARQGNPTREVKTERLKYANGVIKLLQDSPSCVFVPLGKALADEWMAQAEGGSMNTGNKTSDDIFMSLSVIKNAALVTLDENMFDHPDCTAGPAKVLHPYEILETLRV